MTVPTDTTVDQATDATAPEPTTTTDATPEPDRDWKAEADKWKALARKHENASASTLKELDQMRTAQMSESEKAVAEAEKRGREAALKEMRTEMARTKLQAAAAGKVSDVDALLELIDINRLVTDDGVDEAAITAAVDRFTKVVPQAPKFDKVELGPQGDRPRQIGEADLKRMTPEQIVEARRTGALDDLLGVSS